MIVNLIRTANDINLKGTMLVLVNGSITGVKRRSNTRLMHQFSLKGIQALKRERNSLGKDFENVAVKYYDIAKCFNLNAGNQRELISAFKKELGVDIVALIEKISPMGTG